MGDRFCLTMLEAAEMAGFTANEMQILVERHADIAVTVDGAVRIDPDAFNAALDGAAFFKQAA